MANVIQFQNFGNIVAITTKSDMGEGSVIVLPDAYFPPVREPLVERKFLFICKEVQSGVSRSGNLFGSDHYRLIPDIITMTKCIADGFSLRAISARAEDADEFTSESHLSTFSGNPVILAALFENIEALQEDKLIENSAERGPQLIHGRYALQE